LKYSIDFDKTRSSILYICHDIAVNLFQKGSANLWDERYLLKNRLIFT